MITQNCFLVRLCPTPSSPQPPTPIARSWRGTGTNRKGLSPQRLSGTTLHRSWAIAALHRSPATPPLALPLPLAPTISPAQTLSSVPGDIDARVSYSAPVRTPSEGHVCVCMCGRTSIVIGPHFRGHRQVRLRTGYHLCCPPSHPHARAGVCARASVCVCVCVCVCMCVC